MSLCGVALGAANSETALFSSTQFREATAKIEGGIKSYTSPAGAEAMASAMRRDVDRTVEFHLKQHDPVIPQGGHANALVGGHIDGNMQTAPVEYRGGIIAGGVKYRLTPGDVPWIPAGTPHQMLIEKGGSFNYLALKFDAQVAKPK